MQPVDQALREFNAHFPPFSRVPLGISMDVNRLPEWKQLMEEQTRRETAFKQHASTINQEKNRLIREGKICRVKKELKICRYYFKGPHDLLRCTSPIKVISGLMRTLSYATLLIPLFFGMRQLILKHTFSNLSLYGEVEQALTSGAAKPSQNKLIRFLWLKVKGKEYRDFLFTQAMSLLDSKSRNKFYREVIFDPYTQDYRMVPKPQSDTTIYTYTPSS